LTLSDNQNPTPRKNACEPSGLKPIMTSLPAAASNSDCRRRSHPDSRATFIMTIAILAWGSLVWDPRAQGEARRDGHAALLVNDQRQAAIELAI
jgi:hypothetical protein